MSVDYSYIAAEAKSQIEAASDKAAIEGLRIKYLGRKGVLQDHMAKIPELAPEERRAYGSGLNDLKNNISAWLAEKEAALGVAAPPSAAGYVDVTLPGKKPVLGRLHPLTQVEGQICDIFCRLGFKVFKGPEVETEHNNFVALNIPLEHPSRDAFDTFYIKKCQVSGVRCQEKAHDIGNMTQETLLLRSHTSPAQIRAMKAAEPPMAVIMPGRVYRPDAVDASHSFMFHQVEGIAVDAQIRFSDLKGVLIAFAREMFGKDTKLRFRPSFFPFTEPSAEVDISCFLCKAKGCPACKKSGWIEILGCGMMHPHVLRSGGYDTKKWRGFAFGMGVERIAMLKFGVNDIRLFFENDMRFLEQF
ncbi:MAG TPA: phenylalanine--tRNA ligase subunit alpha [Candidatus Omnitrophica bacterium]|nr:phenylalanine--tRNA ligase subunit alpha [Candidatus Omnitrophota bacterium]